MAGQPGELFLGQGEVFEFVLEDDARVEQAVHDNLVAGGLLLFGEGYLCQIVLAVVRVVGQGVFGGGVSREAVGRGLGSIWSF